MKPSNTHRCPRRGCTVVVTDAWFCCPEDWRVLPGHVRSAIGRTAGMSLLSEPRRRAIAAARAAWGDLR